MMEVLVVTGGIGSGKSEVCRIISDCFRCGVYDADARAKSLYLTYPGLLDSMETALGISLRDDEGNFLPSLLAGRIFNDPSALETVESLLFPAMIEDFRLWSRAYQNDCFVVFESATILEKKFFEGFWDKLMIVDAPFYTRLQRACLRDSSPRDRILDRMNNQKLMNRISDGESYSGADIIIINDGTLDDLRAQVIEAVRKVFAINNRK